MSPSTGILSSEEMEMNILDAYKEQCAINKAKMKKNHPGLYKWCHGKWAWVVSVIGFGLLIWRWSTCGF